MKRFYDSKAGKERVSIQPGEMYVTQKNEIIYTVLGSCISVCLRDNEIPVSGMNHFMLPKRMNGTSFSANADKGRFGDEALNELLSEVTRLGAAPSRLTAQVFGGSAAISKCCEKHCVSRENAELAFSFLRARNIPVISADTGGTCGRRIHFDTGSGAVLVEPLKEQGFESCRVVSAPRIDAPSLPSSCCRETRRLGREV